MVTVDLLAVPLVLVGLGVLSLLDLRIAKGPLTQPPPPVSSGQTNGEAQASVEGAKDEKEVEEKDGDPIEEQRFWARSRGRKVTVGGLVLVVVLLRFFALGWDGITGAENPRKSEEGAKIAEDVLMLLFWSIILAILGLAHATTDVGRHSRYLIHLTCLLFVYIVCVFGRLLLPSSSVNDPSAPEHGDQSTIKHVNQGVAWADAVISLVAFLLIGSAPRGPYLIFESSYDAKADVAPSVKDQKTGNVAGIASCSVFDFLFFGWAAPIVREGYSKEQMAETDLPYLTSEYRSSNLFKRITGSIKQAARGQEGVKKAVGGAPKGFNPLLWRVIVINRAGFVMQIFLALLNSFLYYAPAFFLRKIVYFLEHKDNPAEQQSPAFGFAYCAGLLLSMVLEATVSGQLWYLSNSVLCARIRVQLGTALYAKTLRRKDTAGISTAAKSELDDKKKTVAQAPTSAPPRPPIGRARGSTIDRAEAGGEQAPLLYTEEPEQERPGDGANGKGHRKEDDEESEASEKEEKKDESPGTKSQILNLFTVDVDRVADFALWSFSLIDAPAEVIIGAVFLSQLLGVAAFVGLLASLLFLPLNHYSSKWYAKCEDDLMNARDRRVSLMNEVLNSIRMIKYMAWEAPFEERIIRSRQVELKQLRKSFILEVAFEFIWTISPMVCTLVAFLWYTKVSQQVLTPSIAFTSLAVFNEMKFALNVIPETVVDGVKCLVSLRRIQKYLMSPETRADPPEIAGASTDQNSRVVAFRSATISWPSAEDDKPTKSPEPLTPMTPSRRRFQLEDVSADFPEGELSLICGILGSGKSLLLLALLGEAELLAGQILCPRSPPDAIDHLTEEQLIPPERWLLPIAAYVPQSAFLQNADIKHNILFGLPLDEERYEATLKACSLTSDLDILEDGDATEIGEKGVVLSGGQKARVSLARAVYSRASTLLLDDVLAAVDAHTARSIFDNCLKGPLMAGRTLLLVSHHIQLCAPGAKYVVVLEDGGIGFAGSSEEFRHSETYKSLAGDVVADEDEAPPLASPTRPQPRKQPSKLTSQLFKNVEEKNIPAFDSGASSPAESSSEESESESDDDEAEKAPRRLIEEEHRAVGHVKLSIWMAYFKSNGFLIFWILFAAIFLGARGMDVLETYVLRLWSGSNDTGGEGNKSGRSVDYYLALYAIVSVGAVVVDTAQWAVLYFGALRASRSLHESLLHSVLRAPLRWFDKMSLGRLINRFAKDLEGIDEDLPDNFGKSLQYGLGVLTTIVTIASVTPAFLVGFLVLCGGYVYYGRMYTKTARELRRIESVTKSPLFALYSETISGAATIRAFGSSARFMGLALSRIDTNVRFYYFLWVSNRWLSIRYSLLSALIVGLTGFFVLSASDKVDAALAGFALTFALDIQGDVLFLVRRFTALELSLVAVERVREYSEIELEAPGIVEPRPPANWPHSGEVQVDNLTVRYAPDLPDVLHSLTFRIPPGRKVAIVGATGCGKSTLAQSFFRFVEAWEGSIKVDGLDIKNIGLTDLRSRLTIIPQDPTILSGTLRSTLDVFDEFSDEELYESLRRVALIPEHEEEDDGFNENVFRNLDTEVSEQGSNFSQGERQLLCMARALLKRSKLLLLDEATSSIDYKSDALINKTIRAEFSESTLMVIAHRLRTIIDFDHVLVMDAGRILEYDAPSKLLADPNSRFYALCRSTGRSEFKALKRIAEGKPVLKRPKARKSASKAPASALRIASQK